MNTTLSETDYKRVPAEQKERLRTFRMTHPRKQIDLSGTTWSYLLGGQGAETFLILPGGERIGEVAFPLMQHSEQEYRCLYPSFPPSSTMDVLVDGLAALLDRLAIAQVILFAASFGGDVGQCFVRKYPDRVSKLILMNTGIPDEQLGRATKRAKPLVTLLPLGIVRFLVYKFLVKVVVVDTDRYDCLHILKVSIAIKQEMVLPLHDRGSTDRSWVHGSAPDRFVVTA